MDYKKYYKKSLMEFVELLQNNIRKEINEWKKEHYFTYLTTFRGEQLCNDADVIFDLYVARTCNNGEEADKRTNEILKYVKYINEENEDVKWISSKKKKEFLYHPTFLRQNISSNFPSEENELTDGNLVKMRS